jgi:peptidoglycan lytic transglycosylase
MKRWLASLFFFAACSPQPSLIPAAAPPVALAAAIPEGRTPQERRDLFASALELYDRGDAGAAQPLFERVAQAYPELADYAERYLAMIAEVRGDSAEALAHWRKLRDEAADSVWRGEAELALARQRAREEDWAAAAQELSAARTHLKDPTLLASALALASEVADRLGDLRESRALAVELRSRYPRSPEAVAAREQAWADRRSVALADASAASGETSLLLSEGEARRALELVRVAEARFRSDRRLPTLIWLEAEALAKTADREAAERLLERLHASYRGHAVAARALFRLASLAWNRDDDEEALRRFAQYLREYPRGAQAAEALYAVGRVHQEARRYGHAARSFARLARAYPRSPLAGEALFRVGWCHYRAGERAAAARFFQDLAEKASTERPAALYWHARASGEAGGYEQLLDEFPESYYAALAEKRLGRSAGSALAERLPVATAKPTAPACGGAGVHLARFHELKALQILGFARAELAAYQSATPGCDEFLIAAWAEVDGYRQSVSRALHVGGCGLDSPWLHFCYPLAYWPVIERETEQRGVDPYLVAALIRQESLFDAEARSTANAIGLMQLLPATGEREAARLGLADFHTSRLLDPADNVLLGTAYLRELLDRYPDDLPRVLAAYNAGEAAVDKWSRRYPEVDDDEFVESISFRETRGYVKRVLQNRRIYYVLYQATRAYPAAAGDDRPRVTSAIPLGFRGSAQRFVTRRMNVLAIDVRPEGNPENSHEDHPDDERLARG